MERVDEVRARDEISGNLMIRSFLLRRQKRNRRRRKRRKVEEKSIFIKHFNELVESVSDWLWAAGAKAFPDFLSNEWREKKVFPVSDIRKAEKNCFFSHSCRRSAT